MSVRSFKPSEAAEIMSVSVETALDMIHRKQLAAFSVSPPGSKRPRYRITEDTLEAFMRSAAQQPLVTPARRRKPRKHRVKFYT
jgi:excisionase family DNA binding protein